MNVYILCGISGSGKSTWAEKFFETSSAYTRIVSADYYFQTDKGYKFDPTKLSSAHKYCLREFTYTIMGKHVDLYDNLIVDNTNTTLTEIVPYAKLADAFDSNVFIKIFNADLNLCEQRNIHNVPFKVLENQYRRLQATKGLLAQTLPFAEIIEC